MPPTPIHWDRGTLLFDPDAPVRDLDGVQWDPRVGRFRAPGSRLGAIRRALADRGGAAPGPTYAPPAPVAAPALRDYQHAALSAWELAGRRGVVVLPTGGGKTRVAIAAIARTAARTLCLVPTRALLEQWVAALTAAGIATGQYGDGERVEAPVTVATYASARQHVETLGDRFELLVVDEAHHFGAGDELLDMCVAPWRLGLTATPTDPQREGLTPLLGPVVFRQQVGDLAGSWLAPFRILTWTLDLSAAERAAHDAELACWRPAVRAFFRAAPGATWADFVGSAQRTDDGRRALAAWRRSRQIVAFTKAKASAVAQILEIAPASRVIVFSPDNATAYAISRAHLVPAITCDIGRPERARLLAQFADGTLRTLVSSRVLNEGIDVPAADVAVLVGGTQGAREYVQRIGRVLRPSEGKEAVIYELVTRGTHEVAQVGRARRALDVG